MRQHVAQPPSVLGALCAEALGVGVAKPLRQRAAVSRNEGQLAPGEV